MYCFLAFQSYAVELMINEKSELNEDFIIEEIKKAGGANYGTGTRDWRHWNLVQSNTTSTTYYDSVLSLSHIFRINCYCMVFIKETNHPFLQVIFSFTTENMMKAIYISIAIPWVWYFDIFAVFYWYLRKIE